MQCIPSRFVRLPEARQRTILTMEVRMMDNRGAVIYTATVQAS